MNRPVEKNLSASGNRKIDKRRLYEIFIDVGSYKTTVLCLPHGNRYNRKDRLGDITRYLIPFDNEIKEFPSSYIELGNTVKILPNEEAEAIEDEHEDYSFYNKKDVVLSAKKEFTDNFLLYPDGIDSRGNAASFVMYIAELLEHTFKVITADRNQLNDGFLHVNGKNIKIDDHWHNSTEMPQIDRIQVTVPDLYIENLRIGYRKYILQACSYLSSNNEYWKTLLDSYYQFEQKKAGNKQTDKLGTNLNPFVQISADESGAGELYFMNSIKLLSSLRFHDKYCARPEVSLVTQLFSQRDEKHAAKSTENIQRIVCCRIDIGGLTTDADVCVVEFYDTKINGPANNEELRYKLIKKESFSQPVAGNRFKEQYENGDEWWDDIGFIKNRSQCDLSTIIERVVRNQYKAVRQLEIDFDSIYFVISGRPTKAPPVKDVLLGTILREFNSEELLLLKESCIFMSDFPQIYYDQIGKNWHVAKKNPDFAKWVTVAVGEIILSSAKFEIEKSEFTYYIRLEENPPVEGAEIREINGKNTVDLKQFGAFKSQILEKSVEAGLAFSPKKEGEYIPFLFVRCRLCCDEYPKSVDNNCYPKLSVGLNSNTFDSEKSWIIPSIYIQNLDKKIHYLFWDERRR